MRNRYEVLSSFRGGSCNAPECSTHHQHCAYCDGCMHGENGPTHARCAEAYAKAIQNQQAGQGGKGGQGGGKKDT